MSIILKREIQESLTCFWMGVLRTLNKITRRHQDGCNNRLCWTCELIVGQQIRWGHSIGGSLKDHADTTLWWMAQLSLRLVDVCFDQCGKLIRASKNTMSFGHQPPGSDRGLGVVPYRGTDHVFEN